MWKLRTIEKEKVEIIYLEEGKKIGEGNRGKHHGEWKIGVGEQLDGNLRSFRVPADQKPEMHGAAFFCFGAGQGRAEE